jgi:Sulfotransferase family
MALVNAAGRDLSAALSEARVAAARDFAAAVEAVRPALAAAGEGAVFDCIERWWAAADSDAIACAIYLIASAHSADLAAAAGWCASDLGCDDDGVLIALSDALCSQRRPRQAAASMMRERGVEGRSTAFLVKLADHYRTAGRAFLAEDFLREQVRRGRRDLSVRLAEHWAEFGDWRSARDLLRGLPPEETTPASLYLLGRSCAGLLLEDEVVRAIEGLLAAPEPGPRFAGLLRSVWTWRVGDPRAAVARCPAGNYPPLLQRDADMLRNAGLGEATSAPAYVETGVWRDSEARDDLPNVLGIGMQRTGTTWIFEHLGRDPDAHTLPFKEAVFFDDLFRRPEGFLPDKYEADFGALGRLYWSGPTRSLRHYRALFRSEKPFRLDFSPSYGELPEEAVRSIRMLLAPDTKVILSVRDPVERSWSNFLFNLKLCGLNPADFSFSERIALYRNVATLRRCDYAAVARTWRTFFGRVEVVFMDDIEARPCDVLSKVRRFLGMSERGQNRGFTRVNASYDADMPREDRIFLFGLHQSNYDASEAELGGPALGWRRRQIELVG